jgi:hypothetical protein
MKKNYLALITPVFILLSHYLAVFLHEYTHAFMAWVLGYKANPFTLNYGGYNWSNLLLLAHIDENVNYSLLISLKHYSAMALIAFAGPGIANGSMFILSYVLLRNHRITHYPYLFYFLFWFNLMNLGNLYDYIPIRTFAMTGDIYHLVIGLHISPWWIYIIGSYVVAFLIWQFFTKTLTLTYTNLYISSTAGKASLMITAVCILFGFFGGFPYIYFLGAQAVGEPTYLLSATSFFAIPGIIALLWPCKSNR